MIYKSVKSSVYDVDTEKGIVVVGANAFNNEDFHHDISMPGSFTKTLNENFDRLKWHLNHDKKILLGVTLEAKETETHLQTTGKFNLNKSVSRDVYEDYKLHAQYNKTMEHSVGVKAIKRDPIDKRKVSEWYLGEWSTLTTWGANPDTPIFSVKSEDATTIEDQIDWLELSCRKGNFTDLKGKQLEDKIKELRSLLAEPGNADEPSPDTLKSGKLNKLNILKAF